VNTALAQWIAGQCEEALQNCLEAVVIQDDFLNRLNFAHALIRTGRHQKACTYLESFMKALKPDTQKAVVASDRAHVPGYMLWVLADPNAPLPVLAARLRAVRGQEREAQELNAASGQEISQLLQDVVTYVENNEGVCSDFMRVPSTRKDLNRLAETLPLRRNDGK